MSQHELTNLKFMCDNSKNVWIENIATQIILSRSWMELNASQSESTKRTNTNKTEHE